jgi:virginiamycin B lyase
VTLVHSGAIARVSGDGSEVVTIDLPPGSEPHGLAIGSAGAPYIALESGFVLRMPT